MKISPNNLVSVFIAILAMMGLMSVAFSQPIQVGGLIDQPTVWNDVQRPYVVVEDIILRDSLTVMPGVYVDFQEHILTADDAGDDPGVLIIGGIGDQVIIDQCAGLFFTANNFGVTCGINNSEFWSIFARDQSFIHYDAGDELKIESVLFEVFEADDCITITGAALDSEIKDCTIIGIIMERGIVITGEYFGAIEVANSVISNCTNVAIDIIDIERESEVAIFNNLINDCEQGLRVSEIANDPNDRIVWIEENRINADDIGIILSSNIPDNSVQIRNNVIFGAENQGILVETDNDDETPERPLILNNSIFNCGAGLSFSVEDYGEEQIGSEIRNNTIWNCETGVEINFLQNTNTDHIDIRNNLVGNCDVGIWVSDDEDITLEFNAFKNNIVNTNFDDDILDESCVIHSEVANEPKIALINENPNANSWDFRQVIDDAWPYAHFNALINSGFDYNGTRRDPDGSPTNIGVYGGPFGNRNIDASGQRQAFYTWVTDADIFRYEIWLPFETFRLHPDVFPLGDDDNIYMLPGAQLELDNNQTLIIDEGVMKAFGVPDTFIVFRGIDGESWGGIKFTSDVDVAACSLSYVQIQHADYGVYLSGAGFGSAYQL